MSYYITTYCYGNKYEPIKTEWTNRIKERCTSVSNIHIHTKSPSHLIKYGLQYAWWDIMRLYENLTMLLQYKVPVVHIDMDIIVEKDIRPLVDLPYDIIISKEIGGDKAFPPECSGKVGFGVCSGFYVVKPSVSAFLSKLLKMMIERKFNTYSDQVSLMNYIVQSQYEITDDVISLDGRTYINKIISIDGIKLCVLDFNLVIRDPIINDGQFANHINIDNVGGVNNFLHYFHQDLETLPLTCRCGKRHLGDTSTCPHIELRKRK
jgi:hypothetical protein